jgi:hypothetical protein
VKKGEGPRVAKPPSLHIVRVDIAPEVEEAFNQWYDTVHVPALLRCPGWLSARRYVVFDGSPKYLAVYEVAGSWAYETEEFQRVRGFGEFEEHIRNFSRMRCAQIYPAVTSADGEQ